MSKGLLATGRSLSGLRAVSSLHADADAAWSTAPRTSASPGGRARRTRSRRHEEIYSVLAPPVPGGVPDGPARRTASERSGGQILGDPDERAGRGAGAALGGVAVRLALVERGTGDVQVRPAQPVADELLQEHARHQHAAPPVAADVGDVGDRG